MGYDYDDHYSVGQAILERAGIITNEPCMHMYWRLEEDATGAYKLGNALVTKKDPLVDGLTRREVSDAIQSAFDDITADECTHRCHGEDY